MNNFIKDFFFSKKDTDTKDEVSDEVSNEVNKEYYENLTNAIKEVNSLSVGNVFEISTKASNVLNFIVIFKCKTYSALQIDLLDEDGDTTPYVWLKIDKDLKIAAIAKDKETFINLINTVK